MNKEEMLRERIEYYITRCPVEKYIELSPQIKAIEEKINKCKDQGKKEQMQKELAVLLDTVKRAGDELSTRLKDGTFEKRRKEFKETRNELYKLLQKQENPGEICHQLFQYIEKKGHEDDIRIAHLPFWLMSINDKYINAIKSLYKSEICETNDALALVTSDEDWNKVLTAERDFNQIQLKYLKEMLEINS